MRGKIGEWGKSGGAASQAYSQYDFQIASAKLISNA